MNDILKVDGLIKSFGRKKVLRGLSLSLKKGAVCGLLGRNGEGKTTLIRILMGIIPADAGRVVYQDRPISYGSADYKRTVGYVAEDCIFFSGMRVGELLRFNSAFFPSWSRPRAEAYLNRLSLNTKDRIQTLSR
jgi:ABC-2 type transport system ATP-binding protein